MNQLNQQPQSPEQASSKNETMSEAQKISEMSKTLKIMLRKAVESGVQEKIDDVEKMIKENEARSAALDEKYLVERAREAAKEKIDDADRFAESNSDKIQRTQDHIDFRADKRI